MINEDENQWEREGGERKEYLWGSRCKSELYFDRCGRCRLDMRLAQYIAL